MMKKISSYQGRNIRKKTFKDSPKVYNGHKIKFKNKRLCLKCGKKFLSKGPYNRICEKCSLLNERMASSTYSVSGTTSEKQEYSGNRFFELN